MENKVKSPSTHDPPKTIGKRLPEIRCGNFRIRASASFLGYTMWPEDMFSLEAFWRNEYLSVKKVSSSNNNNLFMILFCFSKLELCAT